MTKTTNTKPSTSSSENNHSMSAGSLENNAAVAASNWKKWQSRIEQLEDLMATQSVQLIQCRMELEHFQKQQKETSKKQQDENNNEEKHPRDEAWLEEKVATILWKEQFPKLQRHMETKLQHSIVEKNKLNADAAASSKLRSLQESVTQLQTEFRNWQATVVPQQTQWSDQLVELWSIVQQHHTFTQSLQQQVQTVSQRMQQYHQQQQQQNEHHRDDVWKKSFRELSKSIQQYAADQLEQGSKVQTIVEEFLTQKRALQKEQERSQQQQQQFRQMLEQLQMDIQTWKQSMEQLIQGESERMLHFQTGLISTTDQSIQSLQSQIDALIQPFSPDIPPQHHPVDGGDNSAALVALDWESYRQQMDALQSSKVDKEDWQVLQSKIDEIMEQVQALQTQQHLSGLSSQLRHSQMEDPSIKERNKKDGGEEKKEEEDGEHHPNGCKESPNLLTDHSALLQELREQMRQLQSWMERLDADQKIKDQLWHSQWEQCRVVEHTLQHQLRESQWENRGLYRTLKKLQQQHQEEEPKLQQKQQQQPVFEIKSPLKPTREDKPFSTALTTTTMTSNDHEPHLCTSQPAAIVSTSQPCTMNALLANEFTTTALPSHSP